MFEAKHTALMVALLAAFGIAVHPDVFASGMFYAIAAAYAMIGVKRPSSAGLVIGTIALAMLCATLAAVAVAEVDMLEGTSTRLAMALAGALSRFFVDGVAAFGHGLVDWLGKLPSMFRLPGGGGESK